MTHKNERVLSVAELARVEGEGALYSRAAGGRVEEARLDIYEPPRFFEAFLRGRGYAEPPDITARICGICPVAYQMSACAAIEDACGVTVTQPVKDLRRLIYCGEWIESHALHIYLLHAPDFLGYSSGIEMAAHRRDIVEHGLAMKKAGNAIMEAVGGRAIHPVNVRVGGFYRAPTRTELASLTKEKEPWSLAGRLAVALCGAGIGVLIGLFIDFLARPGSIFWLLLWPVGLGALALATTVVVWRPFRPVKRHVSIRHESGPSRPAGWLLPLCYGAYGFGYIVPATFLPAMARAAGEPAKRPKVAAIFTVFQHRSHAHVLLENFLEPYLLNGQRTDPGVEVVSFYADQLPQKQITGSQKEIQQKDYQSCA